MAASARLVVLFALLSWPARGADWPEFRGPGAQGHVPDGGYAVTWSETEHVVWKAPVPGLGWSSPVIVGDRIYLTTATDEGKSLRALCLGRRDGAILWDREVFRLDDPGRIHRKNSHASPTPIVVGDRLYVHFGAFGTACLSTAGDIHWQTQELKYDHRHGPGGSPVVWRDRLLVSCDGYDVQFVAALDTATGRVAWRKERPSRHAYSTPLVATVDGRDQLISTGADATIAYDPATGDELWRVRYDGYSLVPRPVISHGLVILCTGYDNPTVIAVRLGGTGDVTETHVAWKLDRGAPLNPSPVVVGNELYLVSDQGVASCLDVTTGEKVWQHRLGGDFSASPIVAEGRIYFTNEIGETTVIAAGREYQELAKNTVDGRTLASLAAVDGELYLRTDTHLYRIEER